MNIEPFFKGNAFVNRLPPLLPLELVSCIYWIQILFHALEDPCAYDVFNIQFRTSINPHLLSF